VVDIAGQGKRIICSIGFVTGMINPKLPDKRRPNGNTALVRTSKRVSVYMMCCKRNGIYSGVLYTVIVVAYDVAVHEVLFL
jgi:hypothetical protein